MATGVDFEAPLVDACAAIRVALVPAGGIDGPSFRRLASYVRPLTALDLFAITHGTRSGTLRLRFVESGGGPSDWDDLYPQRRVRAIVGLCQSVTTSDVAGAFRTLTRRVETFPGTAQVRCFIFDPPGIDGGASAAPMSTEGMGAADANHIVVVPPCEHAADLRQHLERLLEDLGTELLRDLRAESETPPTLQSTPVDASAAAERSGMLRLLTSASARLSGRQIKRKADFRLMCGMALEARQGYERAIELLSRSGADAVWHAAALEGASAAALAALGSRRDALPSAVLGGVVPAALAPACAPAEAPSSAADGGGADGGGGEGGIEGGGGEGGVGLSEAYDDALAVARRRLEEAASLCVSRGGRAVEVAVEVGFRLARLVAESGERERARAAADVRDVMGTESGELPPPPSPWRARRLEASQKLQRHVVDVAIGSSETALGYQLQLRVALAAAAFSYELQQPRKAAFYMLDAARRYRDNYQWHAAHEVLLTVAPELQLGPLQWLQLNAPWRQPLPREPHAASQRAAPASAERAAPTVYRMVSVAGHAWSRLREVVLAMLLEASEAMADAPLCVSYALFTLRLLGAALPDAVQQRLLTLLTQAAYKLTPPIRAPAIGLPWLVSIRPLKLPPAHVPFMRRPASGSGGLRGGSRRGGGELASEPPAVFTFSPFEARRRRAASAREAARVVWVSGERLSAVATLANPLCVALRIEHLALHATVATVEADQAGTAPAEGSEGAEGAARRLHFTAFSRHVTVPALCPAMEVELCGCVEGDDETRQPRTGSGGGGETVLRLRGVEAHAYGVACIHPVDAEGLASTLPSSAYYGARKGESALRSGASARPSGLEAQCWVPPLPMKVPLTPPLPLLLAEGVASAIESCGRLHPGLRVSVSLPFVNGGALPVRALDATLRHKSASRLTESGGFVWYEHAPLDLYDESECDGAMRHNHFELGLAAARAQLALSTSHTLQLPLLFTAANEAGGACELDLQYDAIGHSEGGEGTSTPSASAASNTQPAARWARKLTLPLHLPVEPGLQLSPELVLERDVHASADVLAQCAESSRALASGHPPPPPASPPPASPPPASPPPSSPPPASPPLVSPPGALLLLHVRNANADASFELTCTVRPELSRTPNSCDLVWVLSPGESRRLLVPLRCLAEDRAHPLPKSAAMLDKYLRERVPAVTVAEATALRRAHRAKAALLSFLCLRWRRLGGRTNITGVLPMASVLLTSAQVDALHCPCVALSAHCSRAASSRTCADDPESQPHPRHTLTIRATNTSARTLEGLELCVRGRRRRTLCSTDASTTKGSSHATAADPAGHRSPDRSPVLASSRTPPVLFDAATPPRSRASSDSPIGSRAQSPRNSSEWIPRPTSPIANSAAPSLRNSSDSLPRAASPSPASATLELAASATTSTLRWEMAPAAKAHSSMGRSAGDNGGALVDGDADDAAFTDDDGNDSDGSVGVELSLVWAGATNAVIPTLAMGASHDHVLDVVFSEPGDYELGVECVAPSGGTVMPEGVVASCRLSHLKRN